MKKLFIAAEQGLGDTLQFSRYINLAAEAVDQVVFCVQGELIDLFDGAFLDNVTLDRMPGLIPEDADAYVPVMSLPAVLADVSPDVDSLEKANDFIANRMAADYLKGNVPHVNRPDGKRKRVGICWAGAPDQEEDGNRSATPMDFLKLYDAPGIELVSLQMGKRKYELEPYGPLFIDGTSGVRNMLDTAKVMKTLDCVVSVCTSVAHLALATGVSTHVVLPRHGQHWVWGYGDKCLWYPGVTMHRQTRKGDWSGPMASVAAALRGGA